MEEEKRISKSELRGIDIFINYFKIRSRFSMKIKNWPSKVIKKTIKKLNYFYNKLLN